MTVSMLQLVLELPETFTIKDKRRVVSSLKSKISRRFNASCAEIDLLDSIRFAHLGAAIVSNSKAHGEKVMQRVLETVDREGSVRVHDAEIHSESY
jgi:hypothetical protein